VEQSKNYVIKNSKDGNGMSDAQKIFDDFSEFIIPSLTAILNDGLRGKLSDDIESVTNSIFDYYFGLKEYALSELSEYHGLKLKDKSSGDDPNYRLLNYIIFYLTIKYLCEHVQSDTTDTIEVLIKFAESFEDEDTKITVQAINNLENKGIAYLILSYFAERENNLKKSIEAFNKLNGLIKTDMLKSFFPLTLINLALAYEYISDYNTDNGYIDDSLNFLKDAGNPFEDNKNSYFYGLILNSKASCLRKLAIVSNNSSELDLSIENSTEASEVFDSKDYRYHKVSALLNKSLSELYKAKISGDEKLYENALSTLEEALGVLDNNTDNRLYCKAKLVGAVINDALFDLNNSSDDLQKSLDHYSQFLTLLNNEPDAAYIGLINNRLGICYNHLSEFSDKIDNCKKSLQLHKSALDSLPKNKKSYEYYYFRMCESNSFRLLAEEENSQDNCLKAQEGYEDCLNLFNKNDYPKEYAIVNNNLGSTLELLASLLDDKNYLEKSIGAFEQTLQIYNTDDFPYEYAAVQNNLGNSYGALSEYENVVENAQKAIDAYKQALEVRTPDRYPAEHAMTKNNLGVVYDILSGHKDAEGNCKNAIECYKDSLKYYDKESYPNNYAMIQKNLGSTYQRLSEYNDVKENSFFAKQAFEQALEFYTKSD
ncbi:MAG: tetratricopeptide repeat protein, partial [Candidatus Dadabacteria bacterium]|nr:tetratricopeptide repeat protein [Candidatus Dadabacteria bacterium]